MLKITCVSFIFTVYIAICHCRRPFAGPYDVNFKSISKCADLDAFQYNTRVSKYNRTVHSYTSNITLKYGLTDSMKGTADFSIFGNGGWQDNYMHVEAVKGCTDTHRLMPGVFESMAKAAGKEFTGCPIPPGVYEVKNWIFNLRLATPVFPYNKYKVKVQAFENEKILACVLLELEVVPQAVIKHK